MMKLLVSESTVFALAGALGAVFVSGMVAVDHLGSPRMCTLVHGDADTSGLDISNLPQQRFFLTPQQACNTYTANRFTVSCPGVSDSAPGTMVVRFVDEHPYRATDSTRRTLPEGTTCTASQSATWEWRGSVIGNVVAEWHTTRPSPAPAVSLTIEPRL